MATKSWYTSKTMWAAILIGVVGLYNYFIGEMPANLEPLVISLLGTLGLVGLRTAKTQIK